MSSVEMVSGGTANHRRVVGAVLEGREEYPQVLITCGGLQVLSQSTVSSNTTSNGNRVKTVVEGTGDRTFGERSRYTFLKAGGDITHW
jgi:hypothetical protein